MTSYVKGTLFNSDDLSRVLSSPLRTDGEEQEEANPVVNVQSESLPR